MKSITVTVTVNSSIDKVWGCWTNPDCVAKWNQASADWHCPKATNDLRVGGRFVYVMSSRDGKDSFDFNGIYTKVEKDKTIEFDMEGGRKVAINFEVVGGGVKIVETFEMESENSEELQRQGWQAILESFKKHTEDCNVMSSKT